MTPHVLYQIPMASGPVRLLMIALCLLFVLGIYVKWLPAVVRFLSDKTKPKNFVSAVILLVPIAVGLGPLLVLIVLIRNPTTVITETGVTSEAVFSRGLVSFTWSQIDHVDCNRTRSSYRLATLTIVGRDGQRIGIGNAAGVEIYAVRDLLQNQLGPAAMRHCSQIR